ncbi:MarR family transcriptional regulator [Alteromonas sediminis]|uniref:MarR family transcriptional regulator n=1 Tax=Alteromonas sediminis TaxID=2259342 RepID=A0A3N5Z6Z4_9ALTE|nr:MarR family transcriptional regulator [Alteromonas sediminis]RPJ66424.1 MarR family transcriptional regulator [Alteromonas sediminis]
MAKSADFFVQTALLQGLLFGSKIVSKQLDDVFSEIDLKKSSFDVLAALYHAQPDCALTPNELIELTHVTSGSMTSRIDKLAKKGWVNRVSNKRDKRSVKVSLTKSGKKVIEEALKTHESAVNSILSCLTEKEQHRLAKLLGKIAKKN